MSTRSGYVDLETIRDPEGIVGIISERTSNKTYSVAVMKEFPRDDGTERTSFFQRKHINAARRVLDIADHRLAELEAEAEAKRLAEVSARR